MSFSKILDGKKTYLGIATTLLGLFFSQVQVEGIVEGLDAILIAVGAVLSAYGRLKAKPVVALGGGDDSQPPKKD